MRALVAEDDLVSRRMLVAALTKWGYDVVPVQDGEEALGILAESTPPRLVILDWMMPNMDGIDVCRRVREVETESPPYIILLTAKGEKGDIVKGLEAGANDYLSKPYDPGELRARVDIGRRMIEIQGQLVMRVEDLQRAEKRLAEAREREIRLAGRIQNSLLVTRAPGATNGVHLAAMTIPSREVDGDFYDFLPLSRDSMDIVIGDVMGKGVPAALLGAGTKGNVLRVLNGLLRHALDGTLPGVREIVSALHASMVGELMDLESFITLCYARIRSAERVLTCVDCGHTGILHRHAQDGDWKTVRGINMPLGFARRERYEEVRVPLRQDDLLVFFSDGVTEATAPDGTMFGLRRLVETVESYAAEKPAAIVAHVREAVVGFTGASDFADDLTCIVVRVDCNRERRRLAVRELRLTAEATKLTDMRAEVTRFCKERRELAGLDDDALSVLLVAVQELATNIVEHAYRGKEGGVLDVRLESFPDAVRVTLTHDGDSFVADRPAMSEMGVYHEHGYGLYVVDAAVDGCTYGRDENGRNYVSALKLLPVKTDGGQKEPPPAPGIAESTG